MRMHTRTRTRTHTHTLPHTLRNNQLPSPPRRFSSFEAFIEAVYQAHVSFLQRGHSERFMITTHLSRPDCRLFAKPVVVLPSDIEALFGEVEESGSLLMFVLDHMEHHGQQFSSMQAVSRAVVKAVEVIEQQKKVLLCVLFLSCNILCTHFCI